MDYSKIFEDYRIKVEESLASLVPRKEPVSLYEPIKYVLSGGGKRIRPILTLFTCEALGAAPEPAFDAAIAIEVLHNFTLVHDDIMDNADTRRGRMTVHKKWDRDAAILSGDQLVGIAYNKLLKANSHRIREIMEVFTNGILEVCEGQGLDKEFELRKEVSIDDYLIMIEKKTSKLLETCTVIGALIADAGNEEINAVRNYAKNLGLAFQIQDDLLDIFADEKKFGKKSGGDISEGKKTYLLLKAAKLVTGNKDKENIKKILNKEAGIGEKDFILNIQRIYEEYGIFEESKKAIEGFISEADKSLEVISSIKGREMLKWFSAMLLNRNY
jgi:geranylgeranyl diphosphate synthase type II